MVIKMKPYYTACENNRTIPNWDRKSDQVLDKTMIDIISPSKTGEALDLIESSFENGFLYCKVNRLSNFTANGLNFNLNEPQFLLLARGEATSRTFTHFMSFRVP